MSARQHDEDFARDLLASAEDDAMSPRRKAAMAAALGLGTAGAGAASLAGAGAAASKAKLAVVVSILKWLGILAAGGAALATATTVAVRSRHAEQSIELAPHERAANVVSAPTAVMTAMAPPPPSAAPVTPIAPTALAPRVPRVVTTAATTTAATTTTSASAMTVDEPAAPENAAPAAAPARAPIPTTPAARLADEQRTIEEARRALASGDVVSAKRAISEHDAAYPNGAFAQEAEVLHIELLARSGQEAAARSAAAALLAQNPDSPYAARLRAIATKSP